MLSSTLSISLSFASRRKEAREKRAYDEKNFSGNFKYREAYFTRLAKDGLTPLSDEGMNALAALIRQLTASSDE